MTASYKYQDQLESNRLITRFLTPEDGLEWSAFFNDDEAVAFLPSFGLTSNKDRARHWIERQLCRYDENKFGLQALINKETKEFIGQCGLIKQEVDGKLRLK